MSDYILRRALPRDERFIVKTWLDSYRVAHSAGLLSLAEHFEPCPTCLCSVDYSYASVMEKIIRRILRRPGVQVWVASNPREAPPLDLHGWAAVETGANIPVYKPPRYELQVQVSPDPLVHYVFVKKIYREQHLGTSLLRAAGVDSRKRFLYTCHTALSVALERTGKIPLAVWAPLSARFEKGTSEIHGQEGEVSALPGSGAAPAARELVRRDHEAGRRR